MRAKDSLELAPLVRTVPLGEQQTGTDRVGRPERVVGALSRLCRIGGQGLALASCRGLSGAE